ncbi:MAG: GNAT family N-acetyltransferase [Thermoclostridium sp.]|nr:GNAT family N-acetyltransferase [Thermoclostridium sp.]
MKAQLETERLFVRSFKPEDWRDLQEYISREEVMRFESPWDRSDEGMHKAAEDFSKGDDFWAVELKSTGKMIGHLYFGRTGPESFRTRMIGYIFNNCFHGNGYATEACRALLSYAFNNSGVHRVVGLCSPENKPSWKVMERLNMRREGHSLKAVTFRTNEAGQPIWWDEYRYAILAEEWADTTYNSHRLY